MNPVAVGAEQHLGFLPTRHIFDYFGAEKQRRVQADHGCVSTCHVAKASRASAGSSGGCTIGSRGDTQSGADVAGDSVCHWCYDQTSLNDERDCTTTIDWAINVGPDYALAITKD